jgi:hypothetical integral membrane protein (TIGR02206 family)
MPPLAPYFAGDWPPGPFRLFSPQHIAALGTILAVILVACLVLRRKEPWRRPFRIAVAATLVVQEISYEAWHVSIGDFHPGEHLPFHLCGMAVVLSAVVMLTRRPFLFEIVYFWGLGGATQALLTPDLGPYTFPHYRFFHFFLSHGLIWLTVVYLPVVEGLRLRRGALWRVVGFTVGWMALAGGINLLTDGNYGFICHKPETASILDMMGPWPWYVLAMASLGLVVFGLLALPWWLVAWVRSRRAAPSAA